MQEILCFSLKGKSWKNRSDYEDCRLQVEYE